jgi:hypothetical protein
MMDEVLKLIELEEIEISGKLNLSDMSLRYIPKRLVD